MTSNIDSAGLFLVNTLFSLYAYTLIDHGTALDIAGQGTADVGSLRAAENMAITLATQGKLTHG